MLELQDLYHLPELDHGVEQLAAGGPGLALVAGPDPHPLVSSVRHMSFRPSGRSGILRLLMRRILGATPGVQAQLITQDASAIRIPRALRNSVQLSVVKSSEDYPTQITRAADQQLDLLVIDQLSLESTPAALRAAQSGIRVISQFDTILYGAQLARYMLDMGIPSDLLIGLTWILYVQRLPMLCPHCRQPSSPTPDQWAKLLRRHHGLTHPHEPATFFEASGCLRCKRTGREGEVATFDILRSEAGSLPPWQQTSLLPMVSYLLGLASEGYLPFNDVLEFEADQLNRSCHLLSASTQALTEASLQQKRSVAELKAARQVLQQRNDALISLEGIGQALVTSAGLDELGAKLCSNARDLCGADRAILYLLDLKADIAEILAVCGWDPDLPRKPLDARLISVNHADGKPTPFNHRPPGVPRNPSDVTAGALRAGLRIPLIVQDVQVGLMIVHTSQRSAFAPGDVALLQTFANQAAVAIQRAGLVEALREKIRQLEVAQAELVQKERMEREMELARQVQQSVLPRVFPSLPGYDFAAHNEPAHRVGGDFYDVIPLDDKRFGLVIGDVSDKGMPAALYMALTRSLLLAEARREASPRRVLANVHRLLQELGQPGLFVTVFYGVVNGRSGKLDFARAGHDRPLLLREDSIQSLGGEGTFLGFPDMEELYLSEETLDLVVGDQLVLYTDGLTDILSPSKQPFGSSRLVSLLRSNADAPPAELCRITFAALDTFRGTAEQYDDMTMLVMQVQQDAEIEGPDQLGGHEQ